MLNKSYISLMLKVCLLLVISSSVAWPICAMLSCISVVVKKVFFYSETDKPYNSFNLIGFTF